MRKLIAFPCAGETLVATLDEAPGDAGLLIVSGGNEIRIGAHRGMALLAQRVAAAGHPVFRFDRRGIGDSTGSNQGYAGSGEDIAAAAAAFRVEAGVRHLLAFGNCDAATALALFHRDAGIDALLLANPWTIETPDALPPAAAIRARYAERLRDPRQWLRLARGRVDFNKLVKGIAKAFRAPSQSATGLAARLAGALADSPTPVRLLLAEGDATAIGFAEAWRAPAFRPVRQRIALEVRKTASHSFAGPGDKDWLFEQVLKSLR